MEFLNQRVGIMKLDLYLAKELDNVFEYCTQAIITHGFYILNPLFEGQKRFFKEVFSDNSATMYGL